MNCLKRDCIFLREILRIRSKLQDGRISILDKWRLSIVTLGEKLIIGQQCMKRMLHIKPGTPEIVILIRGVLDLDVHGARGMENVKTASGLRYDNI